MEQTFYTKLTLTHFFWDSAFVMRNAVNKGLTKAAEILDKRLHENIDNSTPAGRLYSRGIKTARRTAANKNLRAAPGTKTRVVVGYKYHQASAWGQPPARDTDTLYRNMKVRRKPGENTIIASVNAPGVRVLDSREGLNRPFFEDIVMSYFYNEFEQIVLDIYKGLT